MTLFWISMIIGYAATALAYGTLWNRREVIEYRRMDRFKWFDVVKAARYVDGVYPLLIKGKKRWSPLEERFYQVMRDLHDAVEKT